VIIAKQRISGCTLTLRMHPEMRWGDAGSAGIAAGDLGDHAGERVGGNRRLRVRVRRPAVHEAGQRALAVRAHVGREVALVQAVDRDQQDVSGLGVPDWTVLALSLCGGEWNQSCGDGGSTGARNSVTTLAMRHADQTPIRRPR
jgi:hypothetical protein